MKRYSGMLMHLRESGKASLGKFLLWGRHCAGLYTLQEKSKADFMQSMCCTISLHRVAQLNFTYLHDNNKIKMLKNIFYCLSCMYFIKVSLKEKFTSLGRQSQLPFLSSPHIPNTTEIKFSVVAGNANSSGVANRVGVVYF